MVLENIIFAGGGFKGWAYIGTIKALNELMDFKNIKSVTGVSVGSVFGLFYILGIKWEYLLEYFMELNIKEYLDIDIDNLFINQSLLHGKKLKESIKQIISNKIDPEITFKDLKRYSKILFTTCALNINKQQLEYFNVSLTPDVKIIDAILASCSLPLLLPSYKIGDSFYYDGGCCNNCPTNLVSELNSIAFDLCDSTLNGNNHLINLIYALINLNNKNKIEKKEIVYSILSEKFQKEMCNLNQSKDDIFNIYMHGYNNSYNLLYNNFIALK